MTDKMTDNRNTIQKEGVPIPFIQNGLRNQNTIFVGCDPGNGVTKVVLMSLGSNNRYRVTRVSIPSLVSVGALSDADFIANEQLVENLIEIVDSTNQSYIVAHDLSVCGLDITSLQTGSSYYQSSPARGALVQAGIIKALKELGDPNASGREYVTFLGCTMMAGLYWEGNGLTKNNDKIADVAATLGAPYRASTAGYPIVHNRRTEVFAETLSAALSVLLDVNGDRIGEYEDGSTLAFIDVGHTDTVLLTVKVVKGLPKILSRQTVDIGIDKLVIRPMANKLSNMTNRGVEGGLYLLYDTVFSHRGKKIDLTPLKREAMTGLNTQVLGYLNKTIGRGDNHEATYLVGGFPQIATELFDATFFRENGWGGLYNLIIPENPAYVNAQGALNAMMKRLRETETQKIGRAHV